MRYILNLGQLNPGVSCFREEFLSQCPLQFSFLNSQQDPRTRFLMMGDPKMIGDPELMSNPKLMGDPELMGDPDLSELVRECSSWSLFGLRF